MKKSLFILAFLIQIVSTAQVNRFYHEEYRPQYHFTPAIHWVNDPNGLVYLEGEYHLFYQYNPFGNRWGHMSWGHAISTDLIHWQHLPVAIPEDRDTMIFSGSCVIDINNTSGFAEKPGQTPMVAIYTAHIEGLNQSQHLAYSLDKGRTWKKYNQNPVLDLRMKDFRDPKAFWYEPEKKWIMLVSLPNEKRIQFYSSPNLKSWTLMSEFGPAGDVSGIWECPDLTKVPIEDQPGKFKWLLMLSPQAYMQYFIGEFDGKIFKNENPANKIFRPDAGPDYYAAIAFNNLPANHKPVSIGWANNWSYANDIPTLPWKSAMSLPRELSTRKVGDEWLLIQRPPIAMRQLRTAPGMMANANVTKTKILPVTSQTLELEFSLTPVAESKAGVRLAVGKGEYVEVGYDQAKGILYLDRERAGDVSFNPNFKAMGKYETPARVINGKVSFHVYLDKSLVEVYVNNGENVLTSQFFTKAANEGVEFFSNGKAVNFTGVKWWKLKSTW